MIHVNGRMANTDEAFKRISSDPDGYYKIEGIAKDEH